MEELKPYVSVKEMAVLCGLSRSRFYDLIGTAFPSPLRGDHRRPYYDRLCRQGASKLVRPIVASTVDRSSSTRPGGR